MEQQVVANVGKVAFSRGSVSRAEAFTHSALAATPFTIRLISISPRPQNSPISCKLWHAPHIPGMYQCLSYMWGDPGSEETILLNDQTFAVRKNLFDFLLLARQLKLTDTSLWVDAICINQNDILERNSQVQKMDQIYSPCTGVLIWPGSSTSGHWVRLKTSRGQERRVLIREILQAPYWRRSWIMQEVILPSARNIVTSVGLVEWDVWLRQWTEGNLWAQRLDISGKLDNSIQMKGIWQKYQTIGAIGYLYGLFQRSECSDPRDRIYALRPMVPGLLMELRVNYAEDTSTLLMRVITQGIYSTECSRRALSFVQLLREIDNVARLLRLQAKLFAMPCALELAGGSDTKIISQDYQPQPLDIVRHTLVELYENDDDRRNYPCGCVGVNCWPHKRGSSDSANIQALFHAWDARIRSRCSIDWMVK